jgi:tetratricopeptide (TPR) repeat protein
MKPPTSKALSTLPMQPMAFAFPLVHRLLLACLLVLSCAVTPLQAQDDGDVDFLELAALMLRDGNLERALLALDQVDLSRENADRLRYYTLRGMAHLRRNEFEPAADALERAVATGQAESIVSVYLAQAYFSLEQYREVLNALDSAGAELSRVASVYHMRAQCYWLLKEPAMALATLEQASGVFPDDPGFLRRKVFFLMDLGLYQEAAEQGAEYLARSEGKLEDYVGLGNAMRASGELDKAAQLLELAKLKYPADTRVKKVLANTYMDREQMNAAADLVLEASLLDSSLVSEAAELYRRAGRPNRAMMLNRQIVDQPTKLKQRLALYLEMQRYEQASAMDSDLRRLGLLGDEDIRYALAYAYFKTGDFAAAEDHLQKLTRPDLFRKATELRSAIQDCSEGIWQCL